MARPLRPEYPGALYHVSARGHGGVAVFGDNLDGRVFLQLLGETCARTGWRVHAVCLTPDRYQIVVETPHANLVSGMRQLAGVYTQRFNRHHGHKGALFQGRYKAVLVERETCLLELCREVSLTPVRAGLAAAPEDWRWSSYRVTIGRDPVPPWLEVEWLRERFDGDRKAWQRYVAEGLASPNVWDRRRQQIYLGSEDFVREVETKVASADDPQAGKPRSLDWYADNTADSTAAMAEAWLSGDHSQIGIAKHFDVHYSTVSHAVKRYKARPD